MSKVLALIESLSNTPGRIEKEDLLMDYFMSGEREFFIGARLAFDNLITFGVKKVPEILEDDGSPGTFTFEDFLALAEKLRRRELTGHAARDAIRDAAESCHAPTWNNFYRRILMKNFGVGATDGTVNKVLAKLKAYPEAQKFVIPTFSPQLSHDGEDEKHAKKIRGVKYIDVKMDGVRINAILDKESGTVTFMTRNGQTIENFGEIRTVLEFLMERLPGSVMLDGEFMHPDGFQALMSVLRKEGADTSPCWFGMFDIVPLADFQKGRCDHSQAYRHDVLSALQTSGLIDMANASYAPTDILIADQTPLRRLRVIEKVLVDLDTPEGQVAFAEFNRRAILDGWEGIMIKDPNAPYVTKRTDAWLKKKPIIEVSLTIVGFEEGEAGKQFAGTLGALVMEGVEEGRIIKTNCGSGLTPEDRDDIWANREKFLGMVVEVTADKLTKDKDGDTWSLRFPRVKGFRGRVAGEKL
jgi:DNA ligase-1